MYIFVTAIVISQEKQLSRNTADRDERTISVAAYGEQERRGGRQKGGHRKADRKLLRAYTRSQSQCHRGSRGVRVRVRVRVQRTVTPVSCAPDLCRNFVTSLSSAAAQFGHGAEYRDPPCCQRKQR